MHTTTNIPDISLLIHHRRYVCAECTAGIGQLPTHIRDNITHTEESNKKKIEYLEGTLQLKVKENQSYINEIDNTKTRVPELENDCKS